MASDPSSGKLSLAQVLRERTENHVAVIGMSCRLPGANSPEEYWQLLTRGIDTTRVVEPSRWSADAYYDPEPAVAGKTSTKWAGFIDDYDKFDAPMFRVKPPDAIDMDPQARIVLEVVWEALERSRRDPRSLRGTNAGVFLGMMTNDYAALRSPFTSYNVAAGRVSYFLDVHGPCETVDTYCSSSIVSVHRACQALRSGECEIAIAGGVSLLLLPSGFVEMSQIQALSRTPGGCKTFDAHADGYVRGEGCGIVVLRRVQDAQRDGDPILATIRGSAINHDGLSQGFTAPNGVAQRNLLRKAWSVAGIDPANLGYVEAHGTGTALGDPHELEALSEALSQAKSGGRRVPVASVKANIGHLEGAAGVIGMIKIILAIQNGEIPPHVNMREFNPHIHVQDMPLTVSTERRPWPRGAQRVAAVSSFGLGGTIAHLVVEGAPARQEAAVATASPRPSVVTLSANSLVALRNLAGRLATACAESPEQRVADIARSTRRHRAQLPHRVALPATTLDELRQAATTFAASMVPTAPVGIVQDGQARPKVAFLFTGQGSQYPAMARQLYEEQPVFAAAMKRCGEFLKSRFDLPLLDLLYGKDAATGGSALEQTGLAQPAIFAIEWSLVELWRSLGVEPDIVMGHSVGEIAAACVAGVMSLEDGLALIVERGRAMQALPPGGGMLAVSAPEATVREIVAAANVHVDIAAINGPLSTVISGTVEALDAVSAAVAGRAEVERLRVSHAFHSHLMEPMLDGFDALAKRTPFAPAKIPIVSNLTGDVVNRGQHIEANYWRRHAREPVQFWRGIQSLVAFGAEIMLEVGPHPTLTGLAKRFVEGEQTWVASLRRNRGDLAQLADACAGLWVRGATLNWEAMEDAATSARADLPTYPFERRRYWRQDEAVIVTSPTVTAEPQAAPDVGAAPAAPDTLGAKIRKLGSDGGVALLRSELRTMLERDFLGQPLSDVDAVRPLVDIGLDSIVTVEIRNRLQKLLELKLSPLLVFQYPTIPEMADYLVKRVLSEGAPAPAQAAPAHAPATNGVAAPQSEDKVASVVALMRALSEEEISRVADLLERERRTASA